jgi:hypothetical protein
VELRSETSSPYLLTPVENGWAFRKRGPHDDRAFQRVFLVMSLIDRSRRSWKSGAYNVSKRNQTVTRITGVTKFSQWLISMLTILWVVVSSRLGLAFPRLEGSCAPHFLRRASQPGPSLIKYQFADRIARWSPRRPASWSLCWTPPLDMSGANCTRLRERRVKFLHALDSLSDISSRTGIPRQRWRGLWLIV